MGRGRVSCPRVFEPPFRGARVLSYRQLERPRFHSRRFSGLPKPDKRPVLSRFGSGPRGAPPSPLLRFRKALTSRARVLCPRFRAPGLGAAGSRRLSSGKPNCVPRADSQWCSPAESTRSPCSSRRSAEAVRAQGAVLATLPAFVRDAPPDSRSWDTVQPGSLRPCSAFL